jgi:hypothetical protein
MDVKYVPQWLPFDHEEYSFLGWSDLGDDSYDGEPTLEKATSIIAKNIDGWSQLPAEQRKMRPAGYRVVKREVTEAALIEFTPGGVEKTSGKRKENGSEPVEKPAGMKLMDLWNSDSLRPSPVGLAGMGHQTEDGYEFTVTYGGTELLVTVKERR